MIKDILGKKVEPLDVIAYPGRSGSSVWMNVGTVQGILLSEYYGRPIEILVVKRHAGKKRIVHLTNLRNIVVIPGEAPIIWGK